MTFTDAGLELLKSFEGCELASYQDQGGVWTVGYGHTGADVHPDMTINQAMADALLLQDLSSTESQVQKLIKVQVTDNQYSALVCFAYNIGCGNLAKSTLLNCVNHNQFGDASGEFIRWNHINGVVSGGLTRRREAEAALFISN